MSESGEDVTRRLAARVRELRAAGGLSLDALASRTGVSRSMISLIERGESSPTAAVLDRLAAGLGVTLAALFDSPAVAESAPSPVARRADQAEWRDPESGYVRRNVSPASAAHPMHIVEVRFPAGGRVAFDTTGREGRVQQQVWMLEGTIEIAIGATRHRLQTGDCLAMDLDAPTMFHNPSRKAARYAVVIAQTPPLPRR